MIPPNTNSRGQPPPRANRAQRSTLTPTRNGRYKVPTSSPYFAPARLTTATTPDATPIHIQELQNLMDLETDRKRSLAFQNVQLARENSLLKIKINELNSRVNELLRSNFKVESKFNMSKVHYKRILGEHIDRLECELLEKLQSIIKTLDEVRERESLPTTARFKETNLRPRREMLLDGESREAEGEVEVEGEDGPCRKRRRKRSCTTRRQSMLIIPTGNGFCGSSTEAGSNSSESDPGNNNKTDQIVFCDSNSLTTSPAKARATSPDDIDNDIRGNVNYTVNTESVSNTSTPQEMVHHGREVNDECNRSGKDDDNDDYDNSNKNNNANDKSDESSNDFTGSVIDFPIPEESEERKEPGGKLTPLTNIDGKNKVMGVDTANTTSEQTQTQPPSNIPLPSKESTHIPETRYSKSVPNPRKQKVEVFKDSDTNVNGIVTVTAESSSSLGPSAKTIQQSQPETTNQPPRIRRKRKSVMTDEVLPSIKPERPRRTRGKVVDYTLPSLRVKMRRPSEKLVDATTFVDIHDLQVSPGRHSTSHSLSTKSSRKSSPRPSLKSCVTPMASGTPAPMAMDSRGTINGINQPNQGTQVESQLKLKSKSKSKAKVKVKVKTEGTPNPLSDITNVSKSRTDKKVRQRRKLFKNAIINDLSDENLGDCIPSSSSSSLALSLDPYDSSSNSSGNNHSRTKSFTGNDDSSSSGLISQVSSFRLHEDDLAIFDTAITRRGIC